MKAGASGLRWGEDILPETDKMSSRRENGIGMKNQYGLERKQYICMVEAAW